MRRSLIVLDGDGVLLDYNLAYAAAWEKAFGVRPRLRDPAAYWPIDNWGVPRLSGDKLERFRAAFDAKFWRTVPAIDGALDACRALVEMGYSLVCVTALETRFVEARAANLAVLGFPIDDVIGTDIRFWDRSPKADVINRLMPAAFVDDFLPYHRGISGKVHRALILREPNGSPNLDGDPMTSIHSMWTCALSLPIGKVRQPDMKIMNPTSCF